MIRKRFSIKYNVKIYPENEEWELHQKITRPP